MICLRCGGSGIQRVADQRFRTCVCCLGKGTILDDALAVRTQGSRTLEFDRNSGVSAIAASSSAAR